MGDPHSGSLGRQKRQAKLRALDGGVCPKSFPRILRGFDYGIGCAFVEKNLAGVEGKAGKNAASSDALCSVRSVLVPSSKARSP